MVGLHHLAAVEQRPHPLVEGDRLGQGRLLGSEAEAMSHSMPKWPNSAVATRKARPWTRPVVWALGGPTWLPTSSGGTSSWVQRWIGWRSRASLVSLAQTRSVR